MRALVTFFKDFELFFNQLHNLFLGSNGFFENGVLASLLFYRESHPLRYLILDAALGPLNLRLVL